MNPDGSVTTFDNISVMGMTLIGFDRQDPKVLWARGCNEILKVNISILTASKILLGSRVTGAVTVDSGGINVLTSEYTGVGS